ncbi:MAG TPA: TadE/TadG family type IV pilus assembly protein [Pseudolabrys sp.]|nr:TadE/TadG family type IV pilus assembly protein [Pseudolabrys sp.]
MLSLWKNFRRAFSAFARARKGNVAITFALATLPVVGAVGFAVDYSHANSVKTALQAAIDSTALMISKEAATDTNSQLQANALKYFLALFTRPEAKDVTVTASYNAGSGSQVVITASAQVPTSFLGVIGYDSIAISSSSTAKWGTARLRVALVLDNTGSMADDGKMPALISATKSLLSQLQSAATTDGDVYVSIVPFVKDVNLGAANWNSNYIYWGTAGTQDAASPNETDNTSWDANNGTCQDQGGTILGTSSSYKTRSSCRTKSSCSISGYTSQSSCTSAGSCSVAGYTSQSACTGAGTCSLSGYTSQSACTGAGTCSLSGYSTQSSCTSAGTCSISGHNSQSSCTSAGVCSKSQYTSSWSCGNNGGTWTTGHWTAATWTAATWTATPGTWTAGVWSTATTKWVPDDHSTWNGCVMDRGYPQSPSKLGGNSGPDTVNNYDTNAGSPSVAINSSLYPAEQYSSCPQAAILGLNYDWSGMTSLVNSMSPNGNTNQAIGLQLGWMSLVGGGPFTVPAMDPNYQYQQVIILLTDGLNTQDRWYSSQSSIDGRQQLTCNNINAAGITLYTIQVNTGGDPTSTLLQNCAGSPGKYPDSSKFYLLTQANQITATFNSIGTNLTKLRVAK